MKNKKFAIKKLHERVEYETWLLEEIYRITNQRIVAENKDEIIYPPTGEPPTQTIYCAGNIFLGDWRPGFIEAGAPLILVTAFKIIDMFFEWIIEQNGKKVDFRFKEKQKQLSSPLIYPSLVDVRPWLKERLISLYIGLAPLRGTILHNKEFQLNSGNLRVAHTKGGTLTNPIILNASDLRELSAIAVSLIRHLEETWGLDSFNDKRLRHRFDQIIHIHKEPSLNQLEPGFLSVRIYSIPKLEFVIDLPKIRHDVILKRPGQDVVFNIRLVVIDHRNLSTKSYLIPWVRHFQENALLRISFTELEELECQLPDDLNIEILAEQLKKQ